MSRRRAVHWLIALAVLVGLLVAADRISAAVASNRAEHYLAQQAYFQQPPSVQVHGFPFLTQALAGRYDDVEVRSAAVSLDGVSASDLRAHLHGVHLSLGDAFGASITSLPVDSAEGSLTFSYAEVAKLTAIPGLAITDADGQLHVDATVTVPGLNTRAAISGIGTVQVENQQLRLRVTELTAAGVTITAAAQRQLQALLAVPIPIPALPYGLRIDSLSTGAGGLVVAGEAANLVITRP